MSRPVLRLLGAITFAAGLALGSLPATAITTVVVQTSVQGVNVVMQPVNVTDPATWSFRIAMDTHSQPLSDDLLATVVLVTQDGRQVKPSAWKGTPPGGHHREGVLEFPAPDPAPRSFELRMQRPGEPSARFFRWFR